MLTFSMMLLLLVVGGWLDARLNWGEAGTQTEVDK